MIEPRVILRNVPVKYLPHAADLVVLYQDQITQAGLRNGIGIRCYKDLTWYLYKTKTATVIYFSDKETDSD